MWQEFVFFAHGKFNGMLCWGFSVNVAHENSSQRSYFDRLNECWIRVLLDVPSGLQSDTEEVINRNFVLPSRVPAYKTSTMVYTAAQTTAFIENPAHMGVCARNCQYLSDNEVLAFIHKLIDYVDTDTWKQITDNTCRPPMIPDPANASQMIHQSEFVLSAKSLGCLRISVVSVLFFIMIYCPLYTNNIMCDSSLNNFKVHMDSIKEKK